MFLRKREKVTINRCWFSCAVTRDKRKGKIYFLLRTETSLKVITYFNSFVCRIWCGSWIREGRVGIEGHDFSF